MSAPLTELDDNADLLAQARDYARSHISNPRFRDYILLAIDEAAEGNVWRLNECQNLKWMPVDMEQFLLDKDYMNAEQFLYPKVIDELIHMNAGALYTTAYQLYLLSCYKSPHKQFALDPHSEIVMVFQSITAAKARQVGYDRFKSMIDESSYFKEHFASDPNVKSALQFPNRIEVFLPEFVPGDTVVINLDSLAGAGGQEATGRRCSSEAPDGACADVYAALGLDVETGLPTGAQIVFSQRDRP